MKNNKFLILFVFVYSCAFSQNFKNVASSTTEAALRKKDSVLALKYFNKWSLELGAGLSIGSRPYSDGYGLLDKNNIFNGLDINSVTIGGTYISSKFVSYKMNFSYDYFTNGSELNSKPFETIQYRATIQGQINASRLANLSRDYSRFNVLLHGGIQVGRLMPIPAGFGNKRMSKGDNLAGLTFGITPTFHIVNKLSTFLDISSFNNYGQNLTWNGLGSKVSNNSIGHMYSVTLGLSVGIGKK